MVFPLARNLTDYIFQCMEPLDILRCAEVCRRWNKIIHKSVYIQLLLRQSLHQSQLYDGETSFPLGERLRRLITRETNLDLLRPRVTDLDIPSDQVLHTVAGRYVITQAADEIAIPDPKTGRYTLCTIWVLGTAKKVTADFKPFSDLLDLDVHQDVIIVQEDEGHEYDRKTVLRMRALHLFNEDEKAVPYDDEGFRLEEEGWEGEDPHNISITEAGRVMIWCGGIVWIYDFKTGEKLGRLPPESPKIWESNMGMAWAGKGVVLGLEFPHDPEDRAMSRTEAYIAIFEVDTSYPGTSTLPLLLELPFCADGLEEVVRDILDLPAGRKITTRNQDYPPFIQNNGPFGLILAATEFFIEDVLWRLIIVLPTSELANFQLQKERRVPAPNEAWGNEWSPFEDLDHIPYSEWSGNAYTWAEPADSPSYYHGFYEAQNSLRLYQHNYDQLARHGILNLTILDFNQRRLRTIACDFRTLGGLGKIGEIKTDTEDADRRKPRRYRRTVIQPLKEDDDGTINLGCAEINGEFVLGKKGASNVVQFDGERLFIQQREIGKCWILDFGVREIVGIEGEKPQAEGNGTVIESAQSAHDAKDESSNAERSRTSGETTEAQGGGISVESSGPKGTDESDPTKTEEGEQSSSIKIEDTQEGESSGSEGTAESQSLKGKQRARGEPTRGTQRQQGQSSKGHNPVKGLSAKGKGKQREQGESSQTEQSEFSQSSKAKEQEGGRKGEDTMTEGEVSESRVPKDIMIAEVDNKTGTEKQAGSVQL